MLLKQKGASAQIGAFKQLKVSLLWTSAVDLDLMAFYQTKTGHSGGVYSPNYAGGSLGDLNNFPFIQLSGDEGVEATGGNHREDMLIFNLDQIEKLYICALNFTDAHKGNSRVFSDYDAKVEVVTDQGETHTVSLDSNIQGTVAVIGKICSGFMGAELINDSSVMGFNKFKNTIPGANKIELSSKVTLSSPGDSITLKSKRSLQECFQATLRWKSAVDLDLHCFYRLKSVGTEKRSEGGFLNKLFKSGKDLRDGQVSFDNKGSKNKSPWICLDQDAGIGGAGGDNEENMYFTKIDHLEHALIVVNIYAKKKANFSEYNGVVIIEGGGREFDVPLTESQPGSWCVVARIENTTGTPKLINVNRTQLKKPQLSEFISAL